MGVPHYTSRVLKGIIMEVKDIVIGSVWQGDSDGDYLAIVDEVVFGNYQVDVKLTIFNKCTNELFTKGFNSTYFLKAYSLLVKGCDLNKEYVKGKTDGYSEGYQAAMKVSLQELQTHHNDLRESYNQSKSEGNLDSANVEDLVENAYQKGYEQAYSELHAPKSERERQLQEKAWDEGYKEGEADMLETVNELSAQQAEDCNNGDSISVKDFGRDVEQNNDDFNIGEVWFANDGSGAVRVISIDSEECDTEIVKLAMDSDIVALGESLPVSKEDLKHRWTKGVLGNTDSEISGAFAGDGTENDVVNSPKHYNSDPSGVQCIEITRHRNNNIGNVIKYLWRNGLKDGNSSIQDLEKGAWYLNDEIQRLKGLKGLKDD